MAEIPTSLLFSGPRRPSSIGVLALDVTLVERHELAAQPTEHPVEDGARISDHIIPQPDRITIEGIVSNHPVGEVPESPTRAQSAFDALVELRDRRELVTVVTGFRTYEDMAFVSCSVPRDAGAGQVCRFTAELVKIVKVGARAVEIPAANLEPAAMDRASSVNAGKQTPTPVPDSPGGAERFGGSGVTTKTSGSGLTTGGASLAYQSVFGAPPMAG